MSKFLLNLLLQISKDLVNSKIQFFNSEILFLDFVPADLVAHPASQPSQPTGRAVFHRLKAPDRPIQPARRSRLRGKYVFLFGSRLPSQLPLPRPSVTGPQMQFHPPPPAARAHPRRHRFPATERRSAPRLGCHRAVTTSPSFPLP
jgi:hypothetical protein